MPRFKDTHGDTLRVTPFVGGTFAVAAEDRGVSTVLSFNSTDAGKIAAAVLEAGGIEEANHLIDQNRGVVYDDATMEYISPEGAREHALKLLLVADQADAWRATQASTNVDDELVERIARGMYEMLAARAAVEPVTTWPRTGDGVKEYFRSRARELLKEDD